MYNQWITKITHYSTAGLHCAPLIREESYNNLQSTFCSRIRHFSVRRAKHIYFSLTIYEDLKLEQIYEKCTCTLKANVYSIQVYIVSVTIQACISVYTHVIPVNSPSILAPLQVRWTWRVRGWQRCRRPQGKASAAEAECRPRCDDVVVLGERHLLLRQNADHDACRVAGLRHILVLLHVHRQRQTCDIFK